MRIAVVGAHSFIEDLPSFTNIGTGTGLTLAIWQICKNLVNFGDDVQLVTLQIKPSTRIKGVQICPFDVWRVLRKMDFKSVCDCKNLFQGLPFRMQIRRTKFFLTTGSLRQTLRAGKPDVICINGINWTSLPFVLAAVKERIPFFIILHGLNYADQNLNKMTPRDRKFEKAFTKFLNDEGVPMGCVSSGVKEEATQAFGLENTELLKLVLNSFECSLTESFTFPQEVSSLKRLIRGRKVFMTVSSLTSRKNQMELVDAIASMPSRERDSLCYVIAGDGVEHEAYSKHIEELGLQDTVFMVGRISRDHLRYYYELSDCVALISTSEGFGISAIESFYFGRPVLAYGDLDAIKDLYSPDAMVLVQKRGVTSLAEGMRNIIQREWDIDKIRNWSKNFSHEKNAKQCHELAEFTLKRGTSLKYEKLRSFLLEGSNILGV